MSKKKKILIIEDEKAIARVLGLKLTKAGYDTEIFSNGKDALDFLKKEKVDLILLDLIMPIMDGFTFLEKIQKKKFSVFILSNLGQQTDIEKAKKLGASKFFIKSNVSLSEVVESIKKEIGE
jgi:two-component system phosphate regulon response regulator PhoB